MEVDALKSEIDRISTATEYNGMKLLDGSLSNGGGKVTDFGAIYGSITQSAAIGGGKLTVTANASDITLSFTTDASGKGGENAVWSDDGKTLTINLAENISYKDADIQKLIDNATVPKKGDVAINPNAIEVTFKSEYGVVQGKAADLNATIAGVRQTMGTDGNLKTMVGNENGALASSDTIKLTANTYGKASDNSSSFSTLKIVADVEAGKERAEISAKGETTVTYNGGTLYAADGSVITNVTEGTTGFTLKSTATMTGAAGVGTLNNTGGDLYTKNADGSLTKIANGGTVPADTDAFEIDQNVTVTAADLTTTKTADEVTLHVATGVNYSEKDIENLLKEAGYDYTVELTDSQTPDGTKDGSIYFNKSFKEADTMLLAAADDGKDIFFKTTDEYGHDLHTLVKSAAADGDDITALIEKYGQANLVTAAAGTAVSDLDNGNIAGAALTAPVPDPDGGKSIVSGGAVIDTATEGEGVGKEGVGSIGSGLTFQIGANGVEDQRVTLNVDDMGADALGVAAADVSTRDAANKAIDMVDAAVKKVSMQRAGLGALQNRLEYTVNNLTTTNENLTNAESQIRDTDMATEMINYTKFNILQQASQAMLAQANQQPQAVLQLLG